MKNFALTRRLSNDRGADAAAYIRENLDPCGTLDKSPTSESDARALWRFLESTFRDDNGTGITEADFVLGVASKQSRWAWGVWCVRSATSVFGAREGWLKEDGKLFRGTEDEAKTMAGTCNDDWSNHPTPKARYYAKKVEENSEKSA